MPGRKGDVFKPVVKFEYDSCSILILTEKLVTWSAVTPVVFALFAISVTMPLNFLSL
jgi:hypothetical protein